MNNKKICEEFKDFINIYYYLPIKLQSKEVLYNNEIIVKKDYYMILNDYFFIKFYKDYMIMHIHLIPKEKLINYKVNIHLAFTFKESYNNSLAICFNKISYDYINELKKVLLDFI
jgi:hypothetical protein